MVHSAQDQGWEDSLQLVPSLYHKSPPTTAVEERPGERRKTPYSPDINRITTRLNPPKNGVIALWPNTRVVKCKYCVSPTRNVAKWFNVLLTFKI